MFGRGGHDAPAAVGSGSNGESREFGARWDEEPAGRTQPLPLREVIQRTWKIAAFGGAFMLFSVPEHALFLPYLSSRVECCVAGHELGTRYDLRDSQAVSDLTNEAAKLGISLNVDAGRVRACDVPALPPSSPLWSKSVHCGNAAYVTDSSQKTLGLTLPLQKTTALVVLPIGGGISDVKGRQVVLMAYTICCALAMLMFAFDAAFCRLPLGEIIVFAGGILLCTEPTWSVVNACIADLTNTGDDRDRSRAFSLSQACSAVATLLGFLLTFYCLGVHLTNYWMPWMTLFGTAALLGVLLHVAVPETLPEDMLGHKVSCDMLDPVEAHTKCMRLLARDGVLAYLGVGSLIGHIAYAGWMSTAMSYLVSLGFSFEQAVVVAIVCAVWSVPFTMIMTPIYARIEPGLALVAGSILGTMGYSLCGIVTIVEGRYWIYIGTCVLVSAGNIVSTAAATIVSARTEEANQGKAMAAMGTLGALGTIIGSPLYSYFVFDSTAEGVWKALPSHVSTALGMVCIPIFVWVAMLLHSCGPPPEAAGAEDPASTKNQSYGATVFRQPSTRS